MIQIDNAPIIRVSNAGMPLLIFTTHNLVSSCLGFRLQEKQKDRTSCGSTNREVIVIKEESQDDSKHDVFKQAASASVAGASLSAFGYTMTSSMATSVTTPTPAPFMDTYSSRSRTSTPATVIDKVCTHY